MRKSKLELYEDILNTLTNKQLTIDAIAYACNMDCVLLLQRIDFMIKNGLIEVGENQKKIVYTLTSRGLAISKTLVITKRLEKLQTNGEKLENEMQEIQAISELADKRKRK
jgi:predicted transcriptional regulator